MTQREQASITIDIAARRAGVEPRVVHYCVEVGILDETLCEADLVDLRRVRRLTSLGVSLAGAEIILRMRRQIEELQAEMARLRTVQKGPQSGL